MAKAKQGQRSHLYLHISGQYGHSKCEKRDAGLDKDGETHRPNMAVLVQKTSFPYEKVENLVDPISDESHLRYALCAVCRGQLSDSSFVFLDILLPQAVKYLLTLGQTRRVLE
jgi:hypothetical protein